MKAYRHYSQLYCMHRLLSTCGAWLTENGGWDDEDDPSITLILAADAEIHQALGLASSVIPQGATAADSRANLLRWFDNIVALCVLNIDARDRDLLEGNSS